jgi:hypothetical protein
MMELRNCVLITLEGHTLAQEVELASLSKPSEYRKHVDDLLKIRPGIWDILNAVARVLELVKMLPLR